MANIPPDGKNLELPTASRRDVIKGVAGVAGTAAISSALPKGFAQAATATLPDPLKSGIDHIVVLMMENRSFDHMLGWVPGADGVQAGRTFLDINNVAHQSAALTKFQNCTSADPDHSYSGGRTHFNNGAMDGFLKTVRKAGDTFPIGYFGAKDLAFFASAARHWTICDRYFTGILGPT